MFGWVIYTTAKFETFSTSNNWEIILICLKHPKSTPIIQLPINISQFTHQSPNIQTNTAPSFSFHSMEQLTGAIAEGEWSSLSGTCTAEEAAFMAQLLNPPPPPLIAAHHHESASYCSPSFYRLSQESSEFSGGSQSQCSHLLFPTENNCYIGDFGNNGGFHLEDEDCNLQGYCEPELTNLEAAMEEEEHNQLQLENSKKRSWGSGEVSNDLIIRFKILSSVVI